MLYKPKELTKIYKDLSKKGIKTSEEELLKTIFEFAVEKEEDLTDMLKKKKSEKILKDWLEKSVNIEPTDSLKEHEFVF